MARKTIQMTVLALVIIGVTALIVFAGGTDVLVRAMSKIMSSMP